MLSSNSVKNGAMRRKEQQGGRSNEEERAMRRKEQWRGRSNVEEGATRRKEKRGRRSDEEEHPPRKERRWNWKKKRKKNEKWKSLRTHRWPPWSCFPKETRTYGIVNGSRKWRHIKRNVYKVEGRNLWLRARSFYGCEGVGVMHWARAGLWCTGTAPGQNATSLLNHICLTLYNQRYRLKFQAARDF